MNRMTFLAAVGLLCGAWFTLAMAPALAGIGAPGVGNMLLYVAPGGGNSGACTIGSPCGSVQYAVDQASPGADIRVAAGVYPGIAARAGMTVSVYISKSLSLRGGFTTTNWVTAFPLTQPVTLDAQLQGRVVAISGTAAVTLSGLRIANGFVPAENDGGGGLLVWPGSSLTLSDSVVSNNSAFFGGGIVNGGVLTLTGTSVISNVATSPLFGGGGVHNEGVALLQNCTIQYNTTPNHGGGVYNMIQMVVNNCLISNNSTTEGDLLGGGAGVTNFPLPSQFPPAILTINDSTISYNTTTYSITNTRFISRTGLGAGVLNGAALLDSGTALLTLNRCTVMGNVGVNGGGAANATDELGPTMVMTINQSTIRDNLAIFSGQDLQATGNGGGVLNQRGRLVIMNSAIISNSALVIGSGSLFQVGNGGGILNFNGALALINSTVSGNKASGGGTPTQTMSGLGGGIGMAGEMITTSLWITNSTIASNTATVNGDLLANVFDGYTTTATLQNSLFSGSCYNSVGAAMVSRGYNLETGATCHLGATGDLSATNPRLSPLGDHGGVSSGPGQPSWTHTLLPGSRADNRIPFGISGCGGAIARDQRGFTRPAPAQYACDTGAVEVVLYNALVPLVMR